MRRCVRGWAVVWVVLGLLGAPAMARDSGLDLATMLLEGSGDDRRLALARIVEGERTDLIAPMVTMMRFLGPFAFDLGATLNALTDADHGPNWFDWMVWLEEHPEIEPMADYDRFTADLHARIDENFRSFLHPGVAHTIRLEEVVWGGVKKDGIPSLDDPALIAAAAADYLDADELVFGVAIHGDARAYPLRIMDWHEMFNDVVGGVPVALAYCTLCGSGILYQTGTSAEDRILFGSSGFLYRSNKLMFDRATDSLWNQFTGEPVVGTLAGQKIDLPLRPVTIASWGEWRDMHPQTQVLSLQTGHKRDYSRGAAYADYFASPNLMFPNAANADDRLAAKAHVFVLRNAETAKSWPLERFAAEGVVNDSFAGNNVVLIGRSETRTVRAYARDGQLFTQKSARLLADDTGGEWQLSEDALIGPDGQALPRLPGHVAFWFAPAGFLPETALAAD